MAPRTEVAELLKRGNAWFKAEGELERRILGEAPLRGEGREGENVEGVYKGAGPGLQFCLPLRCCVTLGKLLPVHGSDSSLSVTERRR